MQLSTKEINNGTVLKSRLLGGFLPFLCANNYKDAEASLISIEAYGRILDEYKYCYAFYEVNATHYDELSKLLITTEEKLVKIVVNVKNGIVKDFKLDLNDLVKRFHDKRFEKIIFLGWGLNDMSIKE